MKLMLARTLLMLALMGCEDPLIPTGIMVESVVTCHNAGWSVPAHCVVKTERGNARVLGSPAVEGDELCKQEDYYVVCPLTIKWRSKP